MRAQRTKNLTVGFTAIAVMAAFCTSAFADPIPGRDILKFSQKPMVATTIPLDDGTVGVFYGHDELSTLYGSPQPGDTFASSYQGIAMADDFADRFDTPVVHVKWWGSYLNNEIFQDVDKFLITFESDLKAEDNPLGFSRPDEVLLSQIVTLGPLFPGSGTYTEKAISLGGDPLFETLYEYNAELHLGKEFFQERDTVYWIKIAALVDVFDPANPLTEWGWHNRDYTIFDPLASTPPAVVPGEFDESLLIPYPSKVWHFQDDAVSAETIVQIDPLMPLMPFVQQDNYIPQFYLEGIDGFGPIPFPDGTGTFEGIGRFSKDLAFELYTVPEPASLSLLMLGGLLLCKKPRRDVAR